MDSAASSTSPSKETVTLKLPSGEMVDAIVPAGLSDQQVASYARMKRPDMFGAPAGMPKPQLPQPEAGIGDRAASAAVNSAGGMASLAKPVYEVSAPGILMSYLQKHFPDVAAKIPQALHGAPVQQLPGKIMQAGAGMIAGMPEAEEAGASPQLQMARPQPQAEAPQPQMARPQPQAAMPQPQAATQFPPRGPAPKLQFDAARPMTTGKGPGPGFDTNGITRDIDEDKAIEDAMRADLEKHGMVGRMQSNREFAARNSVDVPKGVRIEQAKNALMGGKIADIGASSIGNPMEPLEFPSGLKAFKAGGVWFAKGGQFGQSAWAKVSDSDLKEALSAESVRGSTDLSQALQQSVANLKGK